MFDRRRLIGNSGEKLAVSFLQKEGYSIRAKNYRKKFGEIDIIGMDGETLVFIEVKTRTTPDYGSPLEAITPRKQKYISRVALDYLANHNLFDTDARFDVVSIHLAKNGPPTFQLIKNAFNLNYGY